MKVTLRKRLKRNKIILYLDYYSNGKRQYEYLDLFLYPAMDKPLSKKQKQHNKENLTLAENIWAKRHLEVVNNNYGFADKTKMKASFIEYVKLLMNERKNSKGNYDNWDSMLKHLVAHTNESGVTFEAIDKQFVIAFKEYLSKVETPTGRKLTQNTKNSYFNKFKAALKSAVNDEIILKNPAIGVEGFKQIETKREFLTLDELRKVAKTDCDFPVLKNAFLFSALTGLRWSDINKLVWSEINYSEELGHCIRFRQKKTKGLETLPISDQAFELLGERGKDNDRVFKGLKYSAWYNLKLQEWIYKAGIYKKITFHCGRHSYACLQLAMGTDIYTISKMLGHRELRTTAIYAKVIDYKKKEAANKIII